MDFKLIVLTGICLSVGYCQGAGTPPDENNATNLSMETTPSSITSSTTTITPTPTPPQSKTWVVVDKTTDETCIVAEIIIQFNFTDPVEIKANANVATGNTIIIVPLDNSTEPTGSCTNTTQIITLKCKENFAEIEFKLGEERNFSANLITLKSTADDLPNCSETVITYNNDAPLLKMQVDVSYKCEKVQQVNVTAVSGESSANLSISHTKFQASRKKKDNASGPGLRFWPIPLDTDVERPLLWVKSRDQQNIKFWTNQLDEILEEYKKLPRSGNIEKCKYNLPPQPGQVCDFNFLELGPCTTRNMYNYNRGGPCIFLKLNKIYGWKPIIYNDTTKLPGKMPQDLKNYIKDVKNMRPSELNTVWVTCEGENPADIENFGPIQYLPSRGFPGYFFPYLNQEGYLSPIVAILFERPASGVRINVVCKAWAQNIDNDRLESTGSVHFALRVDG